MKKKTMVGIVAMVAIALVTMVAGCGGKTFIPPSQTQPEKTEFIQPDPRVSSGSPSVVYVYHQGFMLGGDVHVIVTNRGGSGIVEIIYEITPWPSGKKQTKSRFVYLDAGEKRKVSTFIPLPTGAKKFPLTLQPTRPINLPWIH